MRKTASNVAAAKLELPSGLETHPDEAVIRTLVDRGDKVLHLTLKCALDGEEDGGECNTGIVTEEAPNSATAVVLTVTGCRKWKKMYPNRRTLPLQYGGPMQYSERFYGG